MTREKGYKKTNEKLNRKLFNAARFRLTLGRGENVY